MLIFLEMSFNVVKSSAASFLSVFAGTGWCDFWSQNIKEQLKDSLQAIVNLRLCYDARHRTEVHVRGAEVPGGQSVSVHADIFESLRAKKVPSYSFGMRIWFHLVCFGA